MPRGGKRAGAGRKPKAAALPVQRVPAGTRGAGRGGVIPPAETRFVPGESGNARGRPANVGRTVRETMNDLGAAGLTRAALRAIVDDPKSPAVRAAAALRVLRMGEVSDLADFAEVIDGGKTLRDLRAGGVDTSVVKKLKRGTEGELEIELHDRSGEEFDRVVNHTDGKPTLTLKHTGGDPNAGELPIVLVHTAAPPAPAAAAVTRPAGK